MSNRRPATLTPAQYATLVTTAQATLNTLGVFADDYRALRVIDPKAAARTHAAAVAVWRMATAAVAEVSKWCDHELTEQREALASLKEDLHADEYALSLGSAAREVALWLPRSLPPSARTPTRFTPTA